MKSICYIFVVFSLTIAKVRIKLQTDKDDGRKVTLPLHNTSVEEADYILKKLTEQLKIMTNPWNNQLFYLFLQAK